ncbi:MAG: SpoIIE family protein phosphatase, partial [Bacteroidales bacterium]|nr:SpoIIE family protein phosphatase [Bacteroidales bacterium]
LDIFLDIKDTVGISYTYQMIGNFYYDLEFHNTAKEYYMKALYLDSLTHDYLSMAEKYMMIGYAESDQKKSVEYLVRSVTMFDTIPSDYYYHINNKYSAYQYLAKAYINLANETSESKYADSCNRYLTKIGTRWLDFGEHTNHLLTVYIYTQYLFFYGKYKEALKALIDCKQFLDEKVESKIVLTEYYEHLMNTYAHLKDYQNAWQCSKDMYKYKLSYANDSTVNTIANFKAEEEVKLQRAENKALVAERDRLNIIIIALCVGLALVAAVIFLIIRSLHIKQKANLELAQHNAILDTQNCEITAQRDEIQRQRDEIEVQKEIITRQWRAVDAANSKLIQSINYAQKIQAAAISQKNEIDAVFPENFVFYRPRDIVSGDYYRVAQCGKYRVMIAADCTGHGIPGAFLSMLGISALKEYCVSEHDAAHPGVILDNMRNFIKTTLSSTSQTRIDEGMDMTICCFDFDNMQLRYAAANQSAWLIRNGKATKLNSDLMPVGPYVIEKEHFTSYTTTIENDDMVYMFSDGIPDQPGGDLTSEIGKKFLTRNLVEFLSSISTLPTNTQYELLDHTISTWQNNRPQLDDMTLVGIRVKKE